MRQGGRFGDGWGKICEESGKRNIDYLGCVYVFGLNKYTAKPPVLSDRAVCLLCTCGCERLVEGDREKETEGPHEGERGGMRWNERRVDMAGNERVRKRDGGVAR